MDPPAPRTSGGRGSKGGKNNSNRPPPTRDVQVSKKLSWLLRHGATSENLVLDAGGYANLADVLANNKLRGMKATFAEVREIVEGNDKQRFALKLKEDGGDETSANPRDWMIRANQGHSVKTVESEGLLEPITTENLPEMVVHGTSRAAWTLIVADGGLKPMGRNHIHFAAGLPATFKPLNNSFATPATESHPSEPNDTTTDPTKAQPPVISGMRTTSTILIYLSLPSALSAGIKFWRSANGVILSEGGANGKVGIEFFERVEDRTGEGVLVQDGKVVREAPEAWKPKNGGKGRR